MDLKIGMNVSILFRITIKLSIIKKISFWVITLFIYITQNMALSSSANIYYLQLSQYTTDACYKKIISAVTNTHNNFKLFRIKDLIIQDYTQIEEGAVVIPAVDKIQLEQDNCFTTIAQLKQLDFGKKNIYISDNNRLFEYASYDSNNTKLNSLANITLYLGLTPYKHPIDNSYYLATFSYYSNYNNNNNKIEQAFALNAASPTAIITATNTTIKGLVLVGNIDSTKYINNKNEITATANLPAYKAQQSQNSALIFKGGAVAKPLKITEGITIAKCANLIADTTCGAGLSITNNTKVKAHIYNYGSITAAIAIKLGDTSTQSFPLISDDKHAKFYNYATGIIQSTEKKCHIAIQASGSKDQNIESFSIINYGKIIGGLDFKSGTANNMLTFEVINNQDAVIGNQQATIKKDNAIVNVINKGTIILNGSYTGSAMQVSNYIAEATSQLILMFKNINYNNSNSLIYCDNNAEFKKDSLLIIKGVNQNHINKNDKFIKIITAGTLTFNDNNGKTHLAVQSYYIASEKYIINPIEHVYEGSKTLKIKIKEEKVNEFFPVSPIILKDVKRIIDIANGIENFIFKDDRYIAKIQLKKLVNNIKQINLNSYELVLKQCSDVEDFINNIMPDTSGAAIISNGRINEKLNDHVRQRIAVRLNSKINFNKFRNENKLNYGSLDDDLVMWTGYSNYISKEKPNTEYNYSYIVSKIYSIGLDNNCYDDTTIGAVYGYSKTSLTKYGARRFKNSNSKKNNNHIEKESLITRSFAIYSAYGLDLIDVYCSIMYSQTKHKPKSSKLNYNTKNRIYNIKIFNFTSSCTYPLQAGILSLGVNTQIRYTYIFVPERTNKYNSIDDKQESNIFTFSVGLLAKSTKKISQINIDYDVLIGYYYKYFLGGNNVDSKINDIDIINVPQKMPEKHNLFVATKIMINLTRNIDLEFNINFLVEKNSNDYSYALYARYHL